MTHMKRLILLLTACLALQAQALDYCQTQAFGYGANATGGGNATPILVNDAQQLKSVLNKKKDVVVIITEDIVFENHINLSNMENITILALPGVKLISNEQEKEYSGILNIKNSNNLILRNLTFEGPGAYDCDGFDLLCFDGVTNAWVDHCDFSDGIDGNFDNKHNTDSVTVSWCKFYYQKPPRTGGETDDHRFTNLLGSASYDEPADGTYNLTWAYCWWGEGCRERMVRGRNASLHFLNCYWNSSVAKYCIGPENMDAYVEGGHFDVHLKDSNNIFKQGYGGLNGSRYIDCISACGLPAEANDRPVLVPSYAYEALPVALTRSTITHPTCGAGATLMVTLDGQVSSTCDGHRIYYTVTWNANNGSCPVAKSKVGDGDPLGILPVPERFGYTFTGWFTQPTAGTQVADTTLVTQNVTYFAQYTAIPGSEIPLTPFNELTWVFSTDSFNHLTTISADTTIDQLSFVATDERTMDIGKKRFSTEGQTFTYCLKLGGSASAVYRHVHFRVTESCIIEVYCSSTSTTYDASRTLGVYCGDEFGDSILTTMLAMPDTVERNSFYYFGDATTIYIGSIKNAINIYAINVVYPHQQHATPTLTYDENGGSGTMDEEEGPDVTILPNAFTPPEGYTFLHWNTNHKGSGTTYTPGQQLSLTDDLYLYAIWTPNTYRLFLNNGDAIGGRSFIDMSINATMPNLPLPRREGYTFMGYFTLPDGQGQQFYDANGCSADTWTFMRDTTFYAYWLPESEHTPQPLGALHFWFFNPEDADANGIVNDSAFFTDMYNDLTFPKEGFITIDGISYSVSSRTNTEESFGSFTVPEGLTAVFYALANSSGDSRRLINLVSSNQTIELEVPGGKNAFWRIQSPVLQPDTYTIYRGDAGAVRLGVVVVQLLGLPTPTDLETITNNQSPITNKLIMDGHLLIHHDDHYYNAQGQLLK